MAGAGRHPGPSGRDTLVVIRAGCRLLKSAPIFWGRKDLLVELRRQRRIGYNGRTIAAILGDETEADRRADPFCRVLDVLRFNLLGMLCRSELVAYAFIGGTCPSTQRLPVYPGRWRILEIDFDNNTAKGAGSELFDIWVCSPSLGDAGRDTSTMANQQVKIGRNELSDAEMLVISAHAAKVRKGPASVRLPSSLFPITKLLAQRAMAGSEFASHAEIASLYSTETAPATIRTYISKLRLKLHKAKLRAGDSVDLIQNVHQLGYSLRIAPGAVRFEED